MQLRAPWVHLAISHDGMRLASVSSYPEHVLEIWELPQAPVHSKPGARADPDEPLPAAK